ncbi:Bifunctional protein PyrR [uncultured archaeon]|nr:Bifunctional protein PyrR [uncultured archaeon]
MPETNTKAVLEAEEINEILDRIATEIIERSRERKNFMLVGVYQRGTPIAQRLAKKIKKITGNETQVGSLDVRPYRDDLKGKTPEGPTETNLPAPVAGRHVILVDDVVESGRTTRAAMDALVSLGRPKSIQLVALVDRGHRDFPIQPDYVGRRIPTASRERVFVRLVETDGKDAVTVETAET